MIPGVEIKLSGEAYTLPPLNLTNVRKHEDFFKRVTRGEIRLDASSDDMLTLGSIVFFALKRNYPDITQEQVEDGIDLNNMVKVFAAVMTAQGFKDAAPGEAPGEVRASA